MLVTWEFSSTLKAFLIKLFNELKEEKEQSLENEFTCFQSGKMNPVFQRYCFSWVLLQNSFWKSNKRKTPRRRVTQTQGGDRVRESASRRFFEVGWAENVERDVTMKDKDLDSK